MTKDQIPQWVREIVLSPEGLAQQAAREEGPPEYLFFCIAWALEVNLAIYVLEEDEKEFEYLARPSIIYMNSLADKTLHLLRNSNQSYSGLYQKIPENAKKQEEQVAASYLCAFESNTALITPFVRDAFYESSKQDLDAISAFLRQICNRYQEEGDSKVQAVLKTWAPIAVSGLDLPLSNALNAVLVSEWWNLQDKKILDRLFARA
jgi:hypothetical protein